MIDNIEEVLVNGNLRFQSKITQGLESIEIKDTLPKYPVLILTCMDPRIDVHRIFQLNPGDVFVLRNAGNLYTQDTLRSILVAIYKYKIENIIILGHLDCGMAKLKLLELRYKIPIEFLPYIPSNTMDVFSKVKEFFKPIINEVRNVSNQITSLRKFRTQLANVKIIGMLYDVTTGWVFEYDRFKEFFSMEVFRGKYQEIVEEKQNQFKNFLISIENEIIPPEEGEIIISESELEEIEEEKVEESLVKDYEENLKVIEADEKNISLNKIQFQTSLPKIQVPRINFHGVKIYMPKISRKKNIK